MLSLSLFPQEHLYFFDLLPFSNSKKVQLLTLCANQIFKYSDWPKRYCKVMSFDNSGPFLQYLQISSQMLPISLKTFFYPFLFSILCWKFILEKSSKFDTLQYLLPWCYTEQFWEVPVCNKWCHLVGLKALLDQWHHSLQNRTTQNWWV